MYQIESVMGYLTFDGDFSYFISDYDNLQIIFLFAWFFFDSSTSRPKKIVEKKNDSPITTDNCPHFGANKLLVRLLDFPIKSIYCLPTFQYVVLKLSYC